MARSAGRPTTSTPATISGACARSDEARARLDDATTGSEGYTLTYGYDALDRVGTTTHPDASFEQREYEDVSRVAARPMTSGG